MANSGSLRDVVRVVSIVAIILTVCAVGGYVAVMVIIHRSQPATFTDFDKMAAKAGYKSFLFPTEHFRPGSIVSADNTGCVVGSPLGSLRECYATNELKPVEGKGIAGEFVSVLRSGVKLDVGTLYKVLPRIRLGTRAASAVSVVLQVPETTSAVLAPIRIDDWLRDNWDQMSTACRNKIAQPTTAVINEVVYAPGYRLTFYKSLGQKLEVSDSNIGEFISSELSGYSEAADAGSIVLKGTLPLLYRVYHPDQQALLHPLGQAATCPFQLRDLDRKILSQMMTLCGLAPGGDLNALGQERSYRINRVLTYVVHGTTVNVIDEIKGKWVEGTPLTYEYLVGTASSGSMRNYRVFDNDRKIDLTPRQEVYGNFAFRWVEVGKSFSITVTHTEDNAICTDGSWDLIGGVNRFKYLDSYVTRVYLDRIPTFIDAYPINTNLEIGGHIEGEPDAQCKGLHRSLKGLTDKEMLNRIRVEDIKQGWLFFGRQLPPKGTFAIRVACH